MYEFRVTLLAKADIKKTQTNKKAHAKYRRPPQTTADQPQTNRRTLNTADLDFLP